MDVDIVEMEADAICTRFKKLSPKERNQLAKEGKCFYCKKPGHMAHRCPSQPKQRFPPRSQPRFQPKHCMMCAMEEGEEEVAEEEEDREEGKHRVAHIQQMMMGLSIDEVNEV